MKKNPNLTDKEKEIIKSVVQRLGKTFSPEDLESVIIGLELTLNQMYDKIAELEKELKEVKKERDQLYESRWDNYCDCC